MTLKIQVTTAGRAALVNAQNTGTLPVTVAAIGVTDQAFSPDATLTALPGQLKQLATFAGSAVAADTIHVTIRDDSADTYTLRGFGLFLADGTLFGVYGQAEAILEKSAQAMMLLATDVIFADIDAASLTFGDADFLNPPATTEVQGVVELATDAESTAGTDGVRAVTPKGLMAALNARFGAGNPSSFVKTLLDKASALAFVSALGIRGAASYDTGAGNGLDADLLDGQHGAYYRAWGNLTGVPGTFAPSAHQHSAADITSGTLAVARGGTGAGTFTAGSYLVGNGTDPLASKTPAAVLADIGAAPVVHSHAISAVNGLQNALDAKAPLLSPALTGTPTAPTAAAGSNDTQIANTAFVQQLIANVINGSPGALDTLKELADAMGDDPNFAATVTNALAGKASLSGANFTGLVSHGVAMRITGWGANPSATQGTYIGWNQAGTGYTEFWNNFGTGSGGWRWIALSPAQGIGAGEIAYMTRTGDFATIGSITAVSGNFTGSDENLKEKIEPFNARPLHRGHRTGVALSSYTWRSTGKGGLSPIAQDVLKIAPEHVSTFKYKDGKNYLSIDYGLYATEMATWAAVEIDRLTDVIAELQRRLDALDQNA